MLRLDLVGESRAEVLPAYHLGQWRLRFTQ
jgi:hypothetical protein